MANKQELLSPDPAVEEAVYSNEKDRFFDFLESQYLGITFDDVLENTGAGQMRELPKVIDIMSKFSVNIPVKIPIISSPMTTVTESDMAITMAREGGLGIIHAAMTKEEQYDEVRRVKKATQARIDKPFCVRSDQSLQNINAICKEKRFGFRTFPVQNADGKVVGVLTNKDFEFADHLDLTAADCMTPLEDVHSAPVNTTLEEAYNLMKKYKCNMLPLVKEDGSLAGLYLWSDVKRTMLDVANFNVDENGNLRVGAAVTTGLEGIERMEALDKYADVFVLDTADGDSYYMFQTLREAKKNPNITADIVVGNITSGLSAVELAKAGADGFRVGQGGGSICTTRPETGIGTPQVTAGYRVVRALGGKFAHLPVCSDGGISKHGHISIAIAAGANTVMLGNMLAGTDQAPGEVVIENGQRKKLYIGMGSALAISQNEVSRKRYDNGGGLINPEGVPAYVPYKGDAETVIKLAVASLRKSLRYVKAPNLDYHRRNTMFTRSSENGVRESNPHDVQVIGS
ncbi:MAG TPA: IMP dehydrogenase [Candidatus Saccharimonadales bacterium]|nr:IMP dehydrogenase [Candidatus Saccharimonadales bacterium]